MSSDDRWTNGSLRRKWGGAVYGDHDRPFETLGAMHGDKGYGIPPKIRQTLLEGPHRLPFAFDVLCEVGHAPDAVWPSWAFAFADLRAMAQAPAVATPASAAASHGRRNRRSAGPAAWAAMQPVTVTGPLRSGSIVQARPPQKASFSVAGVQITHPDRELWPGVTKRQLAEYWQAVAELALPGLAQRPLSILRCPEGIAEGKERFFQKNGHGMLPPAIRQGSTAKQPFLAVHDAEGILSLAQMSAIELHPWGAPESEPTRPDRVVFDLDPGDGVPWFEVVKAAHDTRKRLKALGLASFCRTTGGKGSHVVVPLVPEADWSVVKPFCRTFTEQMATEEPTRFLAHLKIADRKGRILIDWLRNGLGATAIGSFSPRARAGATVATPVAWREVTARLDPASYTVLTVPARIARLKADPWSGFAATVQRLPEGCRLRRRQPARPPSFARCRRGSEADGLLEDGATSR